MSLFSKAQKADTAYITGSDAMTFVYRQAYMYARWLRPLPVVHTEALPSRIVDRTQSLRRVCVIFIPCRAGYKPTQGVYDAGVYYIIRCSDTGVINDENAR